MATIRFATVLIIALATGLRAQSPSTGRVTITTAVVPSSQPEIGTICGTVLDESGTPAANVHVIAILTYPGGHSGGFPGTRADQSGHYCIDRLALGHYSLTADDNELGYPMRGSPIYSWPTPDPQVTLTRQRPNIIFEWKIPFRAGFLYLHLPLAHSADDMVPITTTLVVRTRPSLGRMSVTSLPEIGKSKQITLLLPPHEDVLLTISVPGSESRRGNGIETKVLNVLPGEAKDVVVPPLNVMPPR